MDISEAARLIEASPDHRLLRRVSAAQSWAFDPSSGETRRALFVDVETTGLDLERDQIIELALVGFEYERDSGRIVAIDAAGAFQGLRDPGIPIPAESAKVHGITDADVRGQSIDPAIIATHLDKAQLVIAHNAAFDRPMVEKLWPAFETKPWACSLADIDWRSEGLGSAKLDYLLMRQGWFFDDHRALADALAAIFLLSLPLPATKRPALSCLLESARRPLWAVRAEETAFAQRAALKARNYRWDDGAGRRPKAWWTLTHDPEAEIAWLRREIYQDEGRDIAATKVPATKRYSARVWPQ